MSLFCPLKAPISYSLLLSASLSQGRHILFAVPSTSWDLKVWLAATLDLSPWSDGVAHGRDILSAKDKI